MTESIASKNLAVELWASLASLLRSHVAMHAIAQPGGQLRIISSSVSALEILGAYGKLGVLGPDESGRGSIEFRPEAGELGDEYSNFFFLEDGLIQQTNTDVPIDFEGFIEQWLRKVQA